MKKINIEPKVAKKIGLVVAINMLIGSMIGVGIFFKNNNIFAINDNNAIAVLIAWILSAIICLFTAISFAEISSSADSHSGIGGWCYELIGKKFGLFVKIIQPLFYFIVITFSISIFCSESIFNIFSASEKVHIGIIFLIGIVLFLFFLILNFLSIKHSGRFQSVITFLKFIPLFMVVIGGIYSGCNNTNNNLFATNMTFTSNNIIGILVSLPSILFAFDSFISIGVLSKDMKNPKRDVPFAVIVAMIIVGVIYTLVTVGQLLSNSGDIFAMFNKIIANEQAKKAVNIMISVFVTCSVIGVLNAFCATTIRGSNSLIEDHTIIYANQIDDFANRIIPTNNEYKGGLFLTFVFYLFVFIAILIPSLITNSDAWVDGISNFPTTFFFFIYGTVILFGLINRKTKKIQLQKVKGFCFYAVIAILGCYLVFFFQAFYTFTTATIINYNGIMNWGLFSTNNFVTRNWHGTLLFFIYFIIMFIYFIINKVILSKQNPKLRSYFIKAAIEYG